MEYECKSNLEQMEKEMNGTVKPNACLFPNPVFVYTQSQMCTRKQKYTLCRLVTLSKTDLFAVRYFF